MRNVLQSGVAKSGNYWLWKIIDLTLKESGQPRSNFVTNTEAYARLQEQIMTHEDQLKTDVLDVDATGYYWRIGPYHRERIVSLSAYLAKADHIWTHSAYHSNFEPVLSSVGKAVYIIRDPRDIAVSMANFAFTPYVMHGMPHHETDVDSYLQNRLEWSLRSWNQHVSGWLSHKTENCHVVFYERLKCDFDNEYRQLLDFLNISLPRESVVKIRNLATKESMSKKNSHHVRAKRSEVQLSEAQNELVYQVAGPLLDILGYARNQNSESFVELNAARPANEYLNVYMKSEVSLLTLPRAIFALLASRRTKAQKLKVMKAKARSLIAKNIWRA
jgi:aryl sulfotransferase